MTFIVLLSNSIIKKQAFFKSQFGTITNHLKCINAITDTPQPIGNKNGYKVACQRIDNYLKEHNDNTNIIMTIENYLDLYENIWYEKCIVVLRWKDIIIDIVSDTLVEFDNALIPILFNNSIELPLGRDRTLNSIITDIYSGSGEDWYNYFNNFDKIHHIRDTLNIIFNSNKMKEHFPTSGINY